MIYFLKMKEIAPSVNKVWGDTENGQTDGGHSIAPHPYGAGDNQSTRKVLTIA